MRSILIITLTGDKDGCFWGSAFGFGCCLVVIRVKRRFLGSEVAAIAVGLELAFYEQNPESLEAG
ncbi:MAG TPA: hypothetical protein VLH35_01655 [Candidatus Acidoferrales bacterium]|nr:hypothetical protein [Candidatus Acidoferrales bacterium]